MKPTIYIASDHAGFELKELVKNRIPDVNWVDCGPTNGDRVDYPDYADRLTACVGKEHGRGVLICGSGQGMAIRANRHKDIRAALVWDDESTRLARQHNDANVICLGARLLDSGLAVHLIKTFLETPFEGGRHADRIQKLAKPLPENC